jgi:hypothetical protein
MVMWMLGVGGVIEISGLIMFSIFHYSMTQPLPSAPIQIKPVPRPVPRKQLSAPAGPCSIPLLNPPESLQKFVKEIKESTNPFLNGLLNFENIKSSFFSTTVSGQPSEFKVENERVSKSACNNPFLDDMDNRNVFDFNPTTIKSILEEGNDDGELVFELNLRFFLKF